VARAIEVDEERAPFVRKAFTFMASGSYSLAAIVNFVPSKREKSEFHRSARVG
jgi:hypothetical protein